MNNNYHGIVLDVSQKDQSVFADLNIIGRREALDQSWALLKVEVSPGGLERAIRILRFNLTGENFYFHFYRDDELIAVFKERTFRVSTDPATWGEMIEYGKSLGIPEKQLDFYPCRFEDERY